MSSLTIFEIAVASFIAAVLFGISERATFRRGRYGLSLTLSLAALAAWVFCFGCLAWSLYLVVKR